jgi:hypothetical protein
MRSTANSAVEKHRSGVHRRDLISSSSQASVFCLDATLFLKALFLKALVVRKPTYTCLSAWLGPKGGALSGGYAVMEGFPRLKTLD